MKLGLLNECLHAQTHGPAAHRSAVLADVWKEHWSLWVLCSSGEDNKTRMTLTVFMLNMKATAHLPFHFIHSFIR